MRAGEGGACDDEEVAGRPRRPAFGQCAGPAEGATTMIERSARQAEGPQVLRKPPHLSGTCTARRLARKSGNDRASSWTRGEFGSKAADPGRRIAGTTITVSKTRGPREPKHSPGQDPSAGSPATRSPGRHAIHHHREETATPGIVARPAAHGALVR